MPLKTSEYAATVRVDSRRVLETELDRAVDQAIQRALANPGNGILVTRHAPGIFTVELSSMVTQGIISELDLMNP